MTRRQFERRQRLISEGRCPRCGLPVSEWPYRRADVCHVKGASVCPRLWTNIIEAEKRLKVSGTP